MLSKIEKIALLLGSMVHAAESDSTFTNTLEDCLAFADQFDNTCADNKVFTDFDDLDTADVTCPTGYENCPDHGTEEADTCTFSRKLCVSCTEVDGVVKVRAQTDGMPNHCYASPLIAPAQIFVDFTADWLVEAPEEPHSSADTQQDLDDLMCNIMKSQTSAIPESANFEIAEGSDEQQTAWGVAVSGIMIYNGISGEGVDPFYPAGMCGSAEDAVEMVDSCLAHPQMQGHFHYHSASVCVADPTIGETSGQLDTSAVDISDYMEETYTEHMSYRKAFGLAKDGRPIYTPMHGGTEKYDGCDVDICNGMEIGGHYAYVTTFFHPFVMGCYGPGNSPNDLTHRCSANGRVCGTASPEELEECFSPTPPGGGDGGDGPGGDGPGGDGPRPPPPDDDEEAETISATKLAFTAASAFAMVSGI